MVTTALLTAEEFLHSPSADRSAELVRGVLVEMNPPGIRHGLVCARLVHVFWEIVKELQLGQIVANDTGVITERDPDTVRGADVAFYSFATLPAEQEPAGYSDLPPELVCEVTSPSDRRGDLLGKVGEYLNVGVRVVVVVDPQRREVHVFRQNGEFQILKVTDVLALPELHPQLELPISRILKE